MMYLATSRVRTMAQICADVEDAQLFRRAFAPLQTLPKPENPRPRKA